LNIEGVAKEVFCWLSLFVFASVGRMSRSAFAEVQKKLVDTQKQYRHMQQQQATTQREALQAKLTADELAKVSEDTPVYKAIGTLGPPFSAPASAQARKHAAVPSAAVAASAATAAPSYPSRFVGACAVIRRHGLSPSRCDLSANGDWLAVPLSAAATNADTGFSA